MPVYQKVVTMSLGGRVAFTINGVQHTVGSEVSSGMMLVDYIRDVAQLPGTKYMCRGGACGVCCVSVRKTCGGPIMPVNSCMIPVVGCNDWEITTIEGLGNRDKGYHVIQKTLADHNGTQCGYCSPAWVQNMNCLLQNGNKPTMLEIEKSFGGNLCRCTGYRPIAEAFKKFGCDAPASLKIKDIEDLRICQQNGVTCNKTCDKEADWCVVSEDDVKQTDIIAIKLEDKISWYKVNDIQSIFNILEDKGYESYMLMYGNTAQGVEDPAPTETWIDITSVPELKDYRMDQNLIIGLGRTINDFQSICRSSATGDFEYLKKLVEHIDLIASVPLKNLGSVAGNLMLKNQHIGFASDIFLLFATVGAELEICDSKGVRTRITMEQLIKQDMKGKVLVNVLLPPLSGYLIETFKIMPRSQNAHAYVNAGFMYKLAEDHTVLDAKIAYGGLSDNFVKASTTEQFLKGKNLFTNETVKAALNILENELVVVASPPSPSVEYRKQLAMSLFYKGLLSLCPKELIAEKYRSGATKLNVERPVSSSKQTFDSDSALWPLNKPIPKVEALIQCAGEIKYTNDMPSQPHEVHGALVLAKGVGDIVSIDASIALKNPKVLAFYSAADIPGVNSFTPAGAPFYPANEEVFCNGKSWYFDQPVGVIVAETRYIAEKAAELVTVTFKNTVVPILDVEIAKNDASRVTLASESPATVKGTDVVKTIKGKNKIYGQLHIPMELVCCLTIPKDDGGIEVHATTQWPDGIQTVISKACGIPANCIDVYVARIGGGFGLKISRASLIAVASALVTHKMNRSCRIVLPFNTCIKALGKRGACLTEYECDVNGSGVIQSVTYRQYEDNGYMLNEQLSVLAGELYNNCYDGSKWDYKLYDVVTDNVKTTWCRAPGTLESIGMAEQMMERIACELSMDPFDVRVANIDLSAYGEMKDLVEDLKKSSGYYERKLACAEFNKANRWKKKATRTALALWKPAGNSVLHLKMSICHSDGTVMITPGAIEMGQGLNTKAVQICSYMLNIPIEMIKIKGNNTIISTNCFMTGGSLASQNVGLGVRRLCEAMLARLKPIRDTMDNPNWLDLITNAYNNNIDLNIGAYVGATDVFPMNIYGACTTEVIVDVLTGQMDILRVDILQDVGQSVSPEVDVGQVEGAFIMGQGYWTCENLVYDKSGEVLTNKLFEYFAPLIRDIPQDFRVAFRKNSKSADLIFGAKCTGEPPICLPVGIHFAIREAIVACRSDIGIPSNVWFDIDGPMTIEQIGLACKVTNEQLKLN